MLEERIQAILEPGLIPVVRLDSGEDLGKLCESFERGGLRAVELTMTMPDAVRLLAETSKKFQGQLRLGMGTVLSETDANAALEAGAEFLVSPVPVKGMAEAAHSRGVPVIMGAFTPHEAFTAHQYGADFVKIFPLSLASPKYLKTLREPMPFLKLIPSGSITIGMLPELFACGASAVCIGGDLVRKDLIAQENWTAHRENVESAVASVRKIKSAVL